MRAIDPAARPVIVPTAAKVIIRADLAVCDYWVPEPDRCAATTRFRRRLYGSRNPFAFMDLQDVQELSNFFERRVSVYQVGVTGDVAFDHDF